jgi:hypothetical protein
MTEPTGVALCIAEAYAGSDWRCVRSAMGLVPWKRPEESSTMPRAAMQERKPP